MPDNDKKSLINDDRRGTHSEQPEQHRRRPASDAGLPVAGKLAHRNREHIPKRVGHATRVAGACGTLNVTRDISQYTKAKIFDQIGKKTDLPMRIFGAMQERGAADAERDVRGF
jgi:catalase